MEKEYTKLKAENEILKKELSLCKSLGMDPVNFLALNSPMESTIQHDESGLFLTKLGDETAPVSLK